MKWNESTKEQINRAIEAERILFLTNKRYKESDSKEDLLLLDTVRNVLKEDIALLGELQREANSKSLSGDKATLRNLVESLETAKCQVPLFIRLFGKLPAKNLAISVYAATRKDFRGFSMIEPDLYNRQYNNCIQQLNTLSPELICKFL